MSTLDVAKIREDFPILKRKVRDNKQLIYLDNAATDRKSTRLNSSHIQKSRMPSSA